MVTYVSERPVAYISSMEAAGSSETLVTIYQITAADLTTWPWKPLLS
jgi:hypothetical protein